MTNPTRFELAQLAAQLSAKHPGDAPQMVTEALRLWRACGDALRLGAERETTASAAAAIARVEDDHRAVAWLEGLRRLCPSITEAEATGRVRDFCRGHCDDASLSYFSKLRESGWPHGVGFALFEAEFRAWWTAKKSEITKQNASKRLKPKKSLGRQRPR